MSICSLIPPATAISKTQDRADTSVWWKLPFSIFFITYYIQSAIINKVCKPDSKSRKTRVTVDVFCMSSHGVNICVKFHENMSSSFKIMEPTQKLLTDTHRQKRKLYTPLHAYFLCRGYNQSYGSCVLHVISWFNICVKFHESMSSGFELMEHTQKLLTHKGQ